MTYHCGNFCSQQIKLYLILDTDTLETSDRVAIGQWGVCVDSVNVGKPASREVGFNDNLVRAHGKSCSRRVGAGWLRV